jgi:2-amino-4-hydroxy-6-hydroxymethyldihydropteridine diphosphokinase
MTRSTFRDTYLALGSNLSGPWGTPRQCLERAIEALQEAGLHIVAASPQFNSLAVGPRQPRYTNAVIRVRSGYPVSGLLRLARSIERQAGRRQRIVWGPRTLDVDVLMAGKVVYNWPFRRTGVVTLPHPEMHRRAFVLLPLNSVAPHWRHPCIGLTTHDMLQRRSVAERRNVVQS